MGLLAQRSHFGSHTSSTWLQTLPAMRRPVCVHDLPLPWLKASQKLISLACSFIIPSPFIFPLQGPVTQNGPEIIQACALSGPILRRSQHRPFLYDKTSLYLVRWTISWLFSWRRYKISIPKTCWLASDWHDHFNNSAHCMQWEAPFSHISSACSGIQLLWIAAIQCRWLHFTMDCVCTSKKDFLTRKGTILTQVQDKEHVCTQLKLVFESS